MKIILLSGGSGKRLWPLSNPSRSKQFLKLFTSPDGKPESMIQRFNRQIKEHCSAAEVLIATSLDQSDIIKKQLGDIINIVLEPERRDTYPAIALATAYLGYEKNIDSNEVVVVMPCDLYADSTFFSAICEMEKKVKTGSADIVLLGIKPQEANSKFGYIIPDKQGKDAVSYFVEKPDLNYAKKLIQNGALWNGGVFAFKIGYLLRHISKYISGESYQCIIENYNLLPKTSFDYEISEKCSSISFVEFDGPWADIGTWNSLCENLELKLSPESQTNESENTTIINNLGIPIICNGIPNAIIVVTPDGILISDKKRADLIKPLVDNIGFKR